jgi:hypothetical protein
MGRTNIKEFDASSEAERGAARAAGQDAGAAGFAVMSWALWVLGHVDQATARMSAALQRAEAVKEPHTQAYVSYYASVLYALRGEPAVAYQHADRCLTLSENTASGHGGASRGSSARIVRPCSILPARSMRQSLDWTNTAAQATSSASRHFSHCCVRRCFFGAKST